MPTAIITMAGMGRRFSDAGYTVPKYRIQAHGHSLFWWAMTSLRTFIDAGWLFVFVVRADDRAEDFIRGEARTLGIHKFKTVQLAGATDGQATTALLARPAIADPSQPTLIYNIDTFVHPAALSTTLVRGDGWLPCFAADGEAWSFAAADASGRVSEVREKVRISPHATVGLYWFSSFQLLADVYEQHYRNPSNVEKGERYVAPLYNTLIAIGRPVFIHTLAAEAVIPLGVPSDVERFCAMQPPLLEARPTSVQGLG